MALGAAGLQTSMGQQCIAILVNLTCSIEFCYIYKSSCLHTTTYHSIRAPLTQFSLGSMHVIDAIIVLVNICGQLANV